MNRMILAGILIPFAGTTLGSAMVFFMRKEMNEKVQKLLLGFASGVMIAASVWSPLLIKAIQDKDLKLAKQVYAALVQINLHSKVTFDFLNFGQLLRWL